MDLKLEYKATERKKEKRREKERKKLSATCHYLVKNVFSYALLGIGDKIRLIKRKI